jgi:hypothetical protein
MLPEDKDNIDHLDPLLPFKKYGTHLTIQIDPTFSAQVICGRRNGDI